MTDDDPSYKLSLLYMYTTAELKKTCDLLEDKTKTIMSTWLKTSDTFNGLPLVIFIHDLMSSKLHREGSSARGDGSQGGSVALEFCEGSPCKDQATVMPTVDLHYLATPLCQVRQDTPKPIPICSDLNNRRL